ncbi:DUF2075 domain-containing protein [Staphylococcus saprophyticus]|uniref:DNA/RNA helicase domain-containing protein n=1 Tax=Staphylococcus saprophyticus TaxID=29385 RepID=UPI0019D2EBB2|nr:DNA/RNA helicase domain-containing protein [Staphylococcus saprophyticus]MBN6204764.1 DUF2075 domain-containing protein [Staphylococcus saprophyticus]
MGYINLKTLINTYDILKENADKYLLEKYNIEGLKPVEVEDLKKFLLNLQDYSNEISIYDNFYIGYRIKQINPEFDLLKVNDEGVFNIELKSTSTIEKIIKQQRDNFFYLNAISDNVKIITYLSSENKIYEYCAQNDTTNEINSEEVINLFRNFKNYYSENLDEIFEPSKYLISPFNDTEKFLNSKYILTQHQKNIIREILKLDHSHVIQGKAGTGKSLVLYDIAKKLINKGYDIVLIHCGYLNEGHHKFRKNDWDIRRVSNKVIEEEEFKKLDYVLIDETQRYKPRQLKYIVENAIKNNIKMIFSIDENQYFRKGEGIYKNLQFLDGTIEGLKLQKLTEKIRTNKEIAQFIKLFFDNRKNREFDFSNIDVEILESKNNIQEYIDYLKNEGWVYIPFTESKRHYCTYDEYTTLNLKLNSHKVIGQEFDKVIVILDNGFEFKNNSIYYNGSYYYDPIKMLFQNMTRARKKLKFIILDNSKLYKDLITLMSENVLIENS